MLYTPLTKIAMNICVKAHEGQLDKSGLPYIVHPFLVAENVEGEYETCVALLHDVVEDTEVTLDELREAGMPEEVLEAVALMTHDPQVPYMDYVAKLKDNPLAKAVKLSDLKHNMSPGRPNEITPSDEARLERYKKARAFLLS